MKTTHILMIALMATVPGSLFAAPSHTHTHTKPAIREDIPPELAKQVKVTLETATATALAKVPHGEVRSVELEKEHGKLIYSFDIVVPKKDGVEEVAVDAVTGKVVSVQHETAQDERREKEQEKKEHPPSHR